MIPVTARKYAIIFLFYTLVLQNPVFALPLYRLPEPAGFVNDFAGVLNVQMNSDIEDICSDLETDNGTEIAVVVIDSLEGMRIEEYARGIFDQWGIGKQDIDNGVLILISISDREWRLQTGYGVEHILPDSLTSRIMEEYAVPHFAKGDYGVGLLVTTREVSRILKGHQYTPPPVKATRTWVFFTMYLVISAILILLIGRIISMSRVKISNEESG